MAKPSQYLNGKAIEEREVTLEHTLRQKLSKSQVCHFKIAKLPEAGFCKGGV